jgi:hypothetical protein
MRLDAPPRKVTVAGEWNAIMFRRNIPELGSLSSRNVIGVNQKYINTNCIEKFMIRESEIQAFWRMGFLQTIYSS